MSIIAFALLSLVALLLIVSILMPVAERLNTPYTVLLAGVGLLIGTIILALGAIPADSILGGYDTNFADVFSLDSEVILFVFLPVLLFEIALVVNVRRMFDDLLVILLMAIVAVIISTFMIGGTLWAISAGSLTLCLLLAAVISTTDPGAVVAIFRDLGAPRRLLVIVEGESLFNDAAAIVLFSLFLAALTGTSGMSISESVLVFFYGFIVGGAAGFVLGWLFGMLFSMLRGNVLAEITLTVALAYLAFVMGEFILGASGVVAVVIAGLVTGGYGRTLMAADSWPKVIAVWEQLGFWANSLIFLLASMLVPRVLVGVQLQDLLAIVAVYIAAFAARALILYGLLPVFNWTGWSPAMNQAQKGLILWGGIRGAATLALALAVTENSLIPADDRQLVGAVASGFVLVTLLFNATTLPWMTRRLGLDRLSDADVALRSRVVADALEEVRDHVRGVAREHSIADDAISDIEEYYAQRIDMIERDDTSTPVGALDDRMSLGFTMLGNLEGRIYERRFTDNVIGRTAVRGLRATAERLADAARTGGREGYESRMIDVLGFAGRFRIALWISRVLHIDGPLAKQVANRFDELINSRFAIRDLIVFSRQRLGKLVGPEISAAAVETLEARLSEVTRSLEALERQYPDYSRQLQSAILARAGMRWEAERYRRLLDDSLIGMELYGSLERSLDHQRHELFKRSRLDLGLRSEDLLAEVPLFRLLSDEHRSEIADALSTRFVVPGEMIVKKGDTGNEMYFIASGAAQVNLPNRQIMLGSGDFFGEMALIRESQTRSADVVALGYCKLLVLRGRDFSKLRSMRPEIDRHIREAAEARTQELDNPPS